MQLSDWLNRLKDAFPTRRARTRRRKSASFAALAAEVLEKRELLAATGFPGGAAVEVPEIGGGTSGGGSVPIDAGSGSQLPGGTELDGAGMGKDALDKIGTPDPDVAAATEAIAFGDFNGDGYEDMALGMPDKDVGTAIDAGAVRILYGGIGGLQSDHPGVAREYWTQEGLDPVESVAYDNPEAGDHFGAALAAGDFNGDGKDDLAIGSPGEDWGTGENSGQVNILFGGFGGLSATLQWWDHANPLPRERFEATIDGAYGAALTAGDFNGDGKDDLAIGQPGNGRVYVLHGDDALHSSYGVDQGWTPVQYDDEQLGTQVTELFDIFSGYGYFTGDFGATLASGDFDGDGHDDLAVGAPNAELASYPNKLAGATSIIYGSAEGLSIEAKDPKLLTQRFEVPLSVYGNGHGWKINDDIKDVFVNFRITQKPHPLRDQIVEAGLRGEAETGDQFGSSLAAGDFNGDGKDDLAIGSPGDNIEEVRVVVEHANGPDDTVGPIRRDAGAVNIVFGSDSGLTANGNQIWHQENHFGRPDLPDVVEYGDRFGSTLAAGNFDGVGVTDELAIGVPFEDLGSQTDAGLVQFLRYDYGTEKLLPWRSRSEPTGIEATGRFGFALGAGDVNGDGKYELGVSAPHSAGLGTVVSGGDRSKSDGSDAAVHVLYGSNDPYGPGAERVQTWYEGNDTLQTINTANERLKNAVEHGTDGPFGFAQVSTTLNALGLGQQPITIKDGTVTIEGTDGDDSATISADGDLVTVTLVRRDDSGEELLRWERQFAADEVRDLLFQGYGGDDRFANETGIASRANGHDGRDVLLGGSGNDRLYGGNHDDVLKGGSGNDRLYGQNGHDRLYGQNGHDRLYGGRHGDRLYGGRHNDRLYGNAHSDRLYGGSGNDRLYGQHGHDRLYGQNGHDRLYGGRHNDRLYGGSGNDRLYGQNGHDRLYGQSGRDHLDGGRHNDRLYGGDGRDRLYGRSGNDRLDGGYDGDRDYLRGGSGRDSFIQHLRRRVRRWLWSWRTFWSAEDTVADARWYHRDRVYRRRH